MKRVYTNILVVYQGQEGKFNFHDKVDKDNTYFVRNTKKKTTTGIPNLFEATLDTMALNHWTMDPSLLKDSYSWHNIQCKDKFARFHSALHCISVPYLKQGRAENTE